MPRKTEAQRRWEQVLADPNSTPEQKDHAAERIDRVKARHSRIKIARNKLKAKLRANDIEPSHDPLCGMLHCAPGCKHPAWRDRQPDPEPVPKKIEPPKPAPVVTAPIEPAPVKIAPAPKRIARPAPAPVVRKAREGHSGKFFKEVFYDLPIFERNMILKTLNPAQQAEWEQIETNRALEAARVMASMPKETPKPVSEAEKAAAFAPPIMIQPRATGQPQTVDEVRETFGPTMGNATPDSGLSPELDRRGWLPDIPAKELTPSR